MRVRLGLGAVVVNVALLLICVTAWACVTSSGSVSPGSAGPGDPISFSISGVQPGAAYTVRIEGQQAASGVNDSSYNGVNGSFPMPDFGDQAKTVYVYMDVHHDDDGYTWSHSAPVQYVPLAPLTSGVPSPSRAPVSSSPAPARHRATQPKEPHLSVITHAAEDEKRHSTGAGTAVGAAPADSVASEPSSGDRGSGSGAQSKSESSSVPSRVLDAVGSTASVGPAEIPTAGLLLMALVFVVGTALTSFAVYLLQTGPDPRAAIKAPAPLGPDPVDVELQEMIGEEMARQLLSDLQPNGSEPSRSELPDQSAVGSSG